LPYLHCLALSNCLTDITSPQQNRSSNLSALCAKAASASRLDMSPPLTDWTSENKAAFSDYTDLTAQGPNLLGVMAAEKRGDTLGGRKPAQQAPHIAFGRQVQPSDSKWPHDAGNLRRWRDDTTDSTPRSINRRPRGTYPRRRKFSAHERHSSSVLLAEANSPAAPEYDRMFRTGEKTDFERMTTGTAK
jgi:hypothetical protein